MPHAFRPLARTIFAPLLAAMVAVTLAAPVSAQPSPTARIAGVVLDPQDRPVSDARVIALRTDGRPPLTTDADAAGRFVFAGLGDGMFQLTAAAPGLGGAVSNVRPGGASVEIRLRLTAVTESLRVTAMQVEQPLTRSPDSVTVISSEEIRDRQLTTLGGALATVPGFTVARSGGSGTLTSLFPRGGESDFTMVLVDGIRANTFGGGIDLSQIPLADVDRIEVVRGPQSALYGSDAIGGVIQVLTRQGGAPRAAGRIEFGSREYRRGEASTSGSIGGWRWQAGGESFAEEGFTGLTSRGERVRNDEARERQGWVGSGWQGDGGTDVQGIYRYVDTRRGAPGPYGSDPAGRFAGVDVVARGTTERQSLGVRVLQPWGGANSRVRQRVELAVANYRLDFVSSFGPSSSETERTHVRAQTDMALMAAVGASAGVEYTDESAFFLSSFGLTGPVDRRVLGVFGEARWTGDRVSVQAGLRGEFITREAVAANGFADEQLTSANPKVSATWLLRGASAEAPAWTRLRAAIGTGIRPPDLFEIAFTDNPFLKPERSGSIEVGVTQGWQRGALQLDAAGFFNNYDNLIVSVGSLRDVSRYRTDNVSNARSRGMELGAAWQALAPLHVRASYTLLATEILAIDNSAQAPSPYRVGDQLLRRPRHSASLVARWTDDRISLFTSLETRGETLDAEPAFGPSGGLYRNPGRAVLDAGGSYRAWRTVEVFARVLNLGDRTYEDVLGFPSPGRTVFAGARVAVRR